MTPSPPTPLRPFLAAALFALAAACGSFATARVVSLDDGDPARSVWRPEGDPPAAELVDEEHVYYRTLTTSMSFEPALEDYVRRVVEDALDARLDRLRIDFVGYRYAYHAPSRHDDFVLRVELASSAAGFAGELEGVIAGDRLLHADELFGADWEADIPSTGREVGADDRTVEDGLERVADRRAYLHRLALRLATQRLAAAARAASS